MANAQAVPKRKFASVKRR